MLHDARMHYWQRRLGCREILSVKKQCLSLIYDDASKRGISFLGSALLGSRLDGSLYYEVMRVSRLQKDLNIERPKGGKNGARHLALGLEDFAQGDIDDVLWRVRPVYGLRQGRQRRRSGAQPQFHPHTPRPAA